MCAPRELISVCAHPAPSGMMRTCVWSCLRQNFVSFSKRAGSCQRGTSAPRRTLVKLGRVLRMVRQRHPAIAECMVVVLEVDDPVACFRSVKQTVLDAGFGDPSLAGVGRQPLPREQDPEPSQPKAGWQQRATEKLEQKFVREEVWPVLSDSTRTMMRLQHGPLVSAPLTALPHVESNPSRGPAVPRLLVSTFAPAAPADVAANLTCLPSSCSVRCGGGIGEKWRWLLPKCAVKQGPSMSATWIWLSSTISTDNVWRLWQMSHSVAGRAARHRYDLGLSSPP